MRQSQAQSAKPEFTEADLVALFEAEADKERRLPGEMRESELMELLKINLSRMSFRTVSLRLIKSGQLAVRLTPTRIKYYRVISAGAKPEHREGADVNRRRKAATRTE